MDRFRYIGFSVFLLGLVCIFYSTLDSNVCSSLLSYRVEAFVLGFFAVMVGLMMLMAHDPHKNKVIDDVQRNGNGTGKKQKKVSKLQKKGKPRQGK